ncbi:TetR/AcrR family transcriptional regulator [Hydrogenophaga sp. OTU3427]|uniref:TetR/AcrR family transcriptional regulator n=1 Tax=Hydrogenophaga sp. OTU3427 TaxID=3043856 RepID=UPI00313B020D
MPVSKPKNPPPPKRNDVQRQHILDAASLLFIEHGFGGTSFNDIADAVGVTRTALYYYFRSKEAILEALTEGVTEEASKLAQTVSKRQELPPEEALRQLVLQHANLILSNAVQFRVVERSESSLPEAHRAVAMQARRDVLDHFVHVIRRGIDGGQFRVVDPRLAAFSIIGMCNWGAWWFDPKGEMSRGDVTTFLVDFALRGLRPTPGGEGPAATAHDALQQIKESLAVLEARLSAGR